MTREEALRKFLVDWKIGPDLENLVSAAFERGWSAGYDRGRAEEAEASRRRFPRLPTTKSALASWARYIRAQRRIARSSDPRSEVVRMLWAAGDDRQAWDEIHRAVEECAWLVHGGVLRVRGRAI